MATACNISASWLALAVASYSANEYHAEKRAGYRSGTQTVDPVCIISLLGCTDHTRHSPAQNSAVRHVFIRLQQKAIPTITRGPGSRRSRALITRTGILGFIKQDLIELCRQIRQRQVQVMKESMKNLGAVAMLPSRITSLYSEHLLYYRDTNWRICPVVRYSGPQFWSVTNNAPPFYPTASAVFWPFVGRSLR